jgi:hypothetical protein
MARRPAGREADAMDANRRQFVLGTLGMAVAAKLEAATGLRLNGMGAPGAGADAAGNAAYGSGYFGRWAEDEFGLPVFEYTCNQTTDAKAVTPIKPGILLPTEHIHQVGNDRITALASNYGHVRVRQDEGGPKILNDVDPETSQFGGGIGWLTDGRETVSTWYDGSNAKFERVFGVGYFKKRVESATYQVEQTIWAPFGDEPVLISEVKITNEGTAAADLDWVEYWGCQPYQLSFRDGIQAGAKKVPLGEFRRSLGRRFTHLISEVGTSAGLVDAKNFAGRTPEELAAWKATKAYLNSHPTGFIGAIPDEKPGTWFDSGDIPRTFLVSLDGPADATGTDAAAFFGAGGAANPSGLKDGLKMGSGDAHSGMFLLRKLHLGPQESRTLRFLYGYNTEGFEPDALMAKYRGAAANGLKESSAEWKRRGMRFEAAEEPWVKREATWNHYYLRSSMTFDDFFGEHILNQNGLYQYTSGFQGAARDPLQHCLPFLFSDPEIVRSILRYTLKEVRDDGSIPYGIVGHGVIAPIVTDNSSDIPLWLLWTASEYVLTTRDTAFLDEKIRARFAAQEGRTETVRNLLARCYKRQIEQVGVGKHGIVRMLNDDWNDALVLVWAASSMDECVKEGESVLNTTMSAWVFDYYGAMLRYAGDRSGLAKHASDSAEKMRAAARTQWTGKWLSRAWLGEKLGWMGQDTLWIEQQPWAMVAGVTTPAQSRELAETIDAQLRKGPIGAAQMGEGPDMAKAHIFKPGECVIGGVWASLNQTLVWALAQVEPAMAWDEWKKNSFARHAEAYPDVWYGVWSGPDTYNSVLSADAGKTVAGQFFSVIDFPVLNLHSHACYLYGVAKLLGVEFTPEGMTLAPEVPAAAYRFDSPLLGVVKKGVGKYEGWYKPAQAGTWTITVKLPEQAAKSVTSVEVNGVAAPVKRTRDGKIEFRGASSADKALRWALS